jgi:hypothetical protein
VSQNFNIRGGAGLEPLKLSSLQRIVNDLVLLDVMNNPLILHNLRARFERDDIYVRWINAYQPACKVVIVGALYDVL